MEKDSSGRWADNGRGPFGTKARAARSHTSWARPRGLRAAAPTRKMDEAVSEEGGCLGKLSPATGSLGRRWRERRWPAAL
jgi:hypothetical protein